MPCDSIDTRLRYTVFVSNLPTKSPLGLTIDKWRGAVQEIFIADLARHFDAYVLAALHRDARSRAVLHVRLNFDADSGVFDGSCFVDLADAAALYKVSL